jgi:hypothetical protein
MYTSAFDASYSWESVLDEWFLGIGSDLADGSYILVNGDAETWKDSVVNGKAITVKRNRTRFENFFNDEYCASFGKKKLTILVNKL